MDFSRMVVFSSLEFIGIFLPVFFLLYFLVPNPFRNVILLLGSLSFYFVGAWNHPEHFILLLLCILFDFAMGLLVESSRRRKVYLAMGIGFHLFCLGAFKYAGFVVGEMNRCLGGDLVFDLVLPIGISFYTFQGMSYLADVYRGKVPAEKSLLRFAVYLSMFEQLIAGPIVVYGQVRRELQQRSIRAGNVVKGIGIFIIGLGLKVLLANPIGKLWSQVLAIGFESISTPLAWMGIIAYSLQLYLDFFGYSLMAVGLGRMLGFWLPRNFDHPYMSRSMTEFWRRWHITLGAWFREYVYIPLGGNRRGQPAVVRNLLAVWLLTGIWHGAGYNFILWGILLFFIILVEKYITGGFLNRVPVVGHIYMILLIPLTWAVFAVEDLGQLGVLFTRLFPFFGQGPWSVFRYDYLKYLKLYWPFFLTGILFSTKLPFVLLKKIKNAVVLWLLLAAILAASVYCMYLGLDDPFLYFRF